MINFPFLVYAFDRWKSGRLKAEGGISTYIHDSRIGFLFEVNCDTDFFGRSEKFSWWNHLSTDGTEESE
ncbi:translation elongation factor Ts protein [Medicago truncatula]|uniref:Translation elongation factor Ts protein n=1 Tax=Medicago truncatula TaxID=3880 RepID=G7KP03_MEDTR|nr:translation elongation factor Ts protein [Medicago truncatula]